MEMFSNRFNSLFNFSRKAGEKLEQVHYDLAATLQETLEKVLLRMTRWLKKNTGLENLCIGGGVGLNSVANGKILKESGFKNIFIQPASSDAGASLGAALYIWGCLLGNKKRWNMDVFLGKEASNEAIEGRARQLEIPCEKLSQDALINRTARLIADNKIVGWYQGRMEFGPRALGNRSILANPSHPDMKNILNSRVKFREQFRPYAASVLESSLKEYFDSDAPSPYMLLVYSVLEEKRSEIPSVSHVDGTCRVQSVTGESNPLYFKLIERFHQLTGIPMVLNTSFNIRGEPIVRDEKDAFNCFLNTGLDALAAGNYLFVKENHEKY